MGDIAVRVAGLGKEYHIGSRSEQHDRITDALLETIATPFRRIKNVIRGQAATSQQESFWALEDINFEVKYGEVVGIVGHNGAGKSTLLKILSRITEPTKGYADIHGRVGALLEVGTGFHPELTGRENIYLNGAILGMSQNEIKRKFDEIVSFAEIEKFIDTAVKHYSSGMGLRLGFAIAAHLEPEILIVDEVLAVGDMEFQRRCLGKMNQVAESGRTVLFVSHNMTAISSLTSRAVILKKGRMILDGPTQEVISSYLQSSANSQTAVSWNEGERPGDEHFELIDVRIAEGDQSEFASSNPIAIRIKYVIKKSLRDFRIGVELSTHEGVMLFRAYENDEDAGKIVQSGIYESICVIPANLLNEGTHFISIRVNLRAVKHIVILNNLLVFQIYNLSGATMHQRRPGVISPVLEWETFSLSSVYS